MAQMGFFDLSDRYAKKDSLVEVNAVVQWEGSGQHWSGSGAIFRDALERDHHFIKRITAPMMGFKAFHSAAATIAGIETAHMIRKGQFGATGLTAFQQFAQFAA